MLGRPYSYTVVPFGGTGVGKSTLCNFLLQGIADSPFKASETTKGGETKTVEEETGWALGTNKYRKIVQVFDVPGLSDPDLPCKEWAQTIWDKLPSSQNIDMAIMVLKSTDLRMSMPEIMTGKAIKVFIEHL